MIRIPVFDRSEVAEARRSCAAVAQANGYDETDAGRVALAATELATNLVRHAGGGEILCSSFDDPAGSGVQLISLDRGPGMSDPAACLRDGFSTGGSSGHGLGAVRRQASVFDLVSRPGAGTALLARIAPSRTIPGRDLLPDWGAVSVAKPGEETCGDGWFAEAGAGGLTLMVADGLGHGPDATQASTEAIRVFRRHVDSPLETTLSYIHAALRSTRGAAVSIARVRPDSSVAFAGVGNVSGILASENETRRMVTMNGTAGHIARRLQAFEYPRGNGVCVLFSDGISTNWSMTDYPGALRRHPTLLAAIIYRDHNRGRDDATVLVGRWSERA